MVAELPPLIDDVPPAKKKRRLVKVSHSSATIEHPEEVLPPHEVEPDVQDVAVIEPNIGIDCSTAGTGSSTVANKAPKSLPSNEERLLKKGLDKGKKTYGIAKSQSMSSSDEMERGYIEFLEKINSIIMPLLNKVGTETREIDQALGTADRVALLLEREDSLTASIDRLEAENSRLSKAVEWKNDKIKELTIERNHTLKRWKEVEGSIKSFTTKCAKLDIHKDQLEQKVTFLKRDIKRLRGEKVEALKDKEMNVEKCTTTQKNH
ncbi:hypothetical protein J5N97_009954 [Dioscorea zingiberensis]|uniref:Uncharacterized protein n=1 Tax=Dioscorea zingiberensis TaxID=325984 RepID=A0A9D5CZC2_9LILI|nr:hypothetical protein J5N97_009954 [Dioscorea zingiberensis]